MRVVRFLLGSAFCFFALVCSFAHHQQKKEENRIDLIEAQKFARLERGGVSYLQATGKAKFLHNNTYILCDTAILDEQNNIVDAKGHVQIIQDQTQLMGETLHYRGNENLAQVRGPLVELFDQDGNHLRTKFLDFNTKDSIGIFYNGGSMVDRDGNVLESQTGHYYSKEKRFEFERSVEMFTDTVMAKTDFAQYLTDIHIVTLTGNVHAWHTDGYIRSEQGVYERDREYFRFFQNVYVQTDKQEIWADSLFFDRRHTKGSLFGNIQVLDTTQSIILLGDEGHFEQNPQKVWLTRDPVFITYSVDNDNGRDSTFVRGDTLRLLTLPKYQVDSVEVEASRSRLQLLLPKTTDSSAPTQNTVFQRADSIAPLPNRFRPLPPTDSIATPPVKDSLLQLQPLDTLPPHLLIDSIALHTSVDSLTHIHPADSLVSTPSPPLLDSTEIHFLYAYPHVQSFRTNGQGLCDSLVYNSLDSTIRLYGQPVLWHEDNQFSADSIQFFIQNSQISRADLFSSSFVIAQEDSLLFNQIKGNDMVGYFRNNDLYLFEVLANVEFIYCVRENDLITSMNFVEGKKLAVTLKERQPQRLTYYEQTKSNVFPLYELSEEKRRLTLFNWRASERPADRFAITQRTIRPPATETGPQEPKPLFPFTEHYFPGHIPMPQSPSDPIPASDTNSLPPFRPTLDSLFHPMVQDTIRRDSIALALPLANVLVDTLSRNKDTIAFLPFTTPEPVEESEPIRLSRKEFRLQRKAVRKEQAILRKAKRIQRKHERTAAKSTAI